MIESSLVVVAVFAPLVGSLVVLVFRPPGLGAGRIVALACATALGASLGIAAISGSRSDGVVGQVGGLGLEAGRATALLLVAATATAAVVASFARRSVDLDVRAIRFFVLFGALVTGSALVVVPGGWLALSIGWVGASWALVALVGHRGDLPGTRQAQRHTLVALAVGDIALLVAVVLTVTNGAVGPSRNLAEAMSELGSASLLGVGVDDLIALLLVVAGTSRSALVPCHRWLVSTLAAPTPVSALVHAGFVSGAGLLLIRFGPIVLGSFVAVHMAFALAVATVVVGTGAGSRRVDVKGKLAWSTVSQMGFMVVQCTVGALSSAVFHIVGHGMYKASMFLGAGDAMAASMRSTRRAAPFPLPSRLTMRISTLGIATTTVGIGTWLLPPDLSRAGIVLVVVFSWATIAQGVQGWLGRGAMRSVRAVGVAASASLVAVFGYLAGLRLVEAFVKPSFDGLPESAGVSASTLLVTMAAVIACIGGITLVQNPVVDKAAARGGVLLARTAHPGVGATLATGALRSRPDPREVGTADLIDPKAPDDSTEQAVTRSKTRADVARAARVIAPAWPLNSFVAVNPLGGLEHQGFDGASEIARRHLRARTHLSLAEFRQGHEAGLTTVDDLDWAINAQFVDLCAMQPLDIDGRSVHVHEVIRLDMFHSPDPDNESAPQTALERVEGSAGPLGKMIDAAIFHSVGQFAGRERGSFRDQWHTDATQISGLRRHLRVNERRWLAGLSDDPADVITTAFAAMSIDPLERVAEMRGHLCRLSGWAGFAKWRSDWAHADEARRAPSLVDLVAARSALEAACLLRGPISRSSGIEVDSADQALAARVNAVIAAGRGQADDTARDDIEHVLGQVAPYDRNSVWLRAQERNIEQRLLTQLDRLDPGTPRRPPEAQLVFCIDVRSEGLRRHLEATGPYDTIGFAGFFGVAMSVRRLEWDHAEPRCPVLVKPTVRAIERPVDAPGARQAVDGLLARDRLHAGAGATHSAVKYGVGSPFVMAEAAGWIVGPIAAKRTLAPSRRSAPTRPPSVMELDSVAAGGLDLEQRIFTAEAVLKTMGLTRDFAPMIVLCGHASDNVNNPHATALDCGACAGASGVDNARTVARLLNDTDVRAGLRRRDIDIPDTTHFAAALHDTASDHVHFLDTHDIPPAHQATLTQLVVDLDAAARLRSAERGRDLPGPSARVRDRGRDWAQVRSEWGLARNTSFIIGPRSMTAGLDLGGRSFLHTYDADHDPDGKVLETIMTAPLVVAHWISSQYYFSTVDPDVFGAGDKLVHNITAGIGVISGEQGDLRVGLPLQSTHLGAHRHHQPVRLLAVIQAPLERIERIINENAILTTLVEGSWIRVAGRSNPHERWSVRTPNGTWSAEPRPTEITNTLETP